MSQIQMLSAHFSRYELENSPTAIRLGIDNAASDAVVHNGMIAAEGMELVRTELGGVPIHIDSWHRCEALEKILCAKDFSGWCALHGKSVTSGWAEYFARKAHPKGFAVDFTAPLFGTPAEIVKMIREGNIEFDKLIMEGTWAHISFDPQMRGEVLTATFTGGTPYYSKS